MLFNIRRTTIYQAVKIAKTFPPKLVKFANYLFLILAVISIGGYISEQNIFSLSPNQLFGFFLIFMSFSILGGIWLLFFKNALIKNIYLKLPLNRAVDFLKNQELNLAQYLDFNVARAIIKAIKSARKKNVSLSAFDVIICLFKEPRISRIFERLGINKKDFEKYLEKNEQKQSNILYSESLLQTIKEAARYAVNNFHRQIEKREFLTAAANYDPDFRQFLFNHNLSANDVDHVVAWDDFIAYEADWKKKFWKLSNLLRRPGIGKQWAAGYTVHLDKYAADVTKLIKKKNLPLHVIGRKKEIESLERVLSRRGENNALVIGRPGGGRSTIVYSFAKKVLEGRSVPPLNYRRVLELDVQAVLAGTKTPGEALEQIKIIFSEAVNAGNVILIIDNIHNYIGTQTGVGGFDISPALVPYLGSSVLQIIGITTFEGFHKNIEPNSTVMNFFEKVEIEEPSKEETMFILEDLLPGFEKQYGIKIGYKGLRSIVRLTDRYIQNVPFPGKAINLLGEVMAYVKTKARSKKVLPKHVAELLSEKTRIPTGQIQTQEKEKLLNLEQLIHQRVINQEKGVSVLADAMRRTRAGVAGKGKPIGTFLFLGPTGVGKTETSKALTESYFGSEKMMIRLDMSEYRGADSIRRLIGSSDGTQQGLLTNAIREAPFSLVLLDEIEKAHPDILNLFLQILDEGRLTDALGRTVSFKNAIIIGTSNAGAEFIRQYVSSKEDYNHTEFKKQLVDHLLRNSIFRPEFLNRFDAIVIFRPLTKENLIKIAKLMLKKLNKRLMQGRGVRLIITEELAEKIAELGYKPELGARPMNRVIQDKIENKIAKKILKNELQRGNTIQVDPKELFEEGDG